MSRHAVLPILLCLLLAVALAGALASPVAARPQADLDEPIDLELRNADLRQTLFSLATVAGLRFDAPEDLEGGVTVALESTPWRESVDQLCRIHRLACSASQGDDPTLHVRPSTGFAGLAQPISLSLRDADLMSVLDAFDAITGDGFSVIRDEDWDAEASIEFHALPWHLALEHLCDLAGCALDWHDDHVVVTPRPVEWKSASEGVTDLETDPQLVAFDRVEIVMHEDVARRLPDPDALPDFSAHATYVEALDAFCAETGCQWRLEWADPAVLRLWPRGSSPRAGGSDPVSSDAQAGSPRAGALPVRGLPPLALRVEVGDGEASEDVELSWSRPRHSLGVVRGRDGAPGTPGVLESATFLHLVWIPFAPDRQVLLPLGLACGPDGRRVEAFDPVALPLGAPWVREVDGTRLEIRPLERSSEAAATASGPHAPRRSPMEALCSFPARSLEVRILPSAADDGARRTQLLEGTTPGTYLLASPAGTGGDVPAVALVLLGPAGDGGLRVGLVRPDGPELRQVVVGPGETRREAFGSVQELRLRLAGDAARD